MGNARISDVTPVKSRGEYVVALKNKNGVGKSPAAGKKYHFIGAGGVGMSGLAALLLKEKAIVSGSDMQSSAIVDKLGNGGADIKIGHSPENVPKNADAVVISAAIRHDNPELIKARDNKVMVYKYAQMLGLIMDRYDGIAVAGTHGKSTVSGWLVYTIKQMGLDPNFIIGADISKLKASCGIGSDSYFVAEACEYDRSFLNFHPRVGVILNIEADHLDYYADENEIIEAFSAFAGGIRPGGVLVAGTRDKNVAKVVASLRGDKEILSFGIGDGFDLSAENIDYEKDITGFDVYFKGNSLGRAQIKLLGEHNVMNALAVLAAGIAAGIDAAEMITKLGDFSGMDRRMAEKGRFNGIVVLDDYGHHPTEIKASLQAVRQKYDETRLICVFQPHQYSRTRFLLKDFAESFSHADLTIVPEIYFVRDTALSKQEINAEKLVEKINSNGSNAIFADSFERICEFLKSNVKSGDVVITIGAGDIWKVADEYIQWLERNS